jgi:hypothetical protein
MTNILRSCLSPALSYLLDWSSGSFVSELINCVEAHGCNPFNINDASHTEQVGHG